MSNIRNKPCRCGSGKKYKHCHLPLDEQRVANRRRFSAVKLSDLLSIRLGELAAQDLEGFDEGRNAPARETRALLLEKIGNGLIGAPAAKALEEQLAVIEARMRVVLAERPAELWFILSRRLPPVPIHGCSPWTVLLYRRVLTLAILKHGGRDREAHFETAKTPVGEFHTPTEADDEALRQIAALEVLACEHALTAAAFRRVGKGASLRLSTDTGFDTPASPDIQRLIESVDARNNPITRERYDTGAETQEPTLALFTLRLNVSGETSRELEERIGLNLPRQTIYVPGWGDIAGTRTLINLFPEPFREAYGVDPDVALATAWAVASRLPEVLESDPGQARQALTTGYHTLRADERSQFRFRTAAGYLVWMEANQEDGPSAEEGRAQAGSGVEALTYSDDDLAAISLWDRLPFKCIVPFGDRLYVDYEATLDVIAGFQRTVGVVVGEDANRRGEHWEKEVARRGETPG